MTNPEENRPKPWPAYIWGIFILVVGVGLFFYLGYLEQHGGSLNMTELFILVYQLLGRWGLLALFLVPASIFFGLEIKERRKRPLPPQDLPKKGENE